MAKMKVFLKLMLVVGVIFGIFFGLGTGLTHLLTSPVGILAEDSEQAEEEQQATVEKGKRTSILILGVDARPGDDHPRSDTMLLATIDPELNKVAVISIPRDTKVKLKNGQTDKITAANSLGGPTYAVAAVEKLMDTNIDYYVEMDFNGFKDIVDALGGVTVNVPQRMYKPSEDIDLRAGTQRLNGKQALGFVRFRDYAMGDIQRTAAQQEFLKALTGEILKPATLTKLPKLARTVDQCTDSNLRLGDLLRMVTWAPGFTSESLVTQTLPGSFYDERDSYGTLLVSYWLADSDKISTLVDNMLAGKTVAVVQESETPSVVRAASSQLQNPPELEDQAGSQVDQEDQEDIEDAEAPVQDAKKPQQGVEEKPYHKNNEGQPVNTEPQKNPDPGTVEQAPFPENTPVNTPPATDPTGPAGYI